MWPMILAAGAPAVLGGVSNYLGQRETNEANVMLSREMQQKNEALSRWTTEANVKAAESASQRSHVMMRENQEWQKDMSNTAYQRSMEDMKKAGLNPMLAFSQGGASTPSGAMGTSSGGSGSPVSSGAARVENALERGVSSAIDGARLAREFKSADANIALTRAQKEVADEQRKLIANNAKKVSTEIPAVDAKSKYDVKSYKFDSDLIYADKLFDRLGSVLNFLKPGGVLNPRRSK